MDEKEKDLRPINLVIDNETWKAIKVAAIEDAYTFSRYCEMIFQKWIEERAKKE